MSKCAQLLLMSIVLVSPLIMLHAQDTATSANLSELKTLIVTAEPNSDSVIAVAPITSQRIVLQRRKNATKLDISLESWLEKQAALNGLQSTDIHPWHL